MKTDCTRDVHHAPLLHQLFGSFLRMGITAFGGPTMIAYIRKNGCWGEAMAYQRILWVVLGGTAISAFAFWEYFQKEVNYVDCPTFFQFPTASFSSFGGLTGKEQSNGANSIAFTRWNLPMAGKAYSTAGILNIERLTMNWLGVDRRTSTMSGMQTGR